MPMSFTQDAIGPFARNMKDLAVTLTIMASVGSDLSDIENKGNITALIATLQRTFVNNNLTAVIYPEQKNHVVPIGSSAQTGRNGILAALTGAPVVTIPRGFSPATDSSPVGIPIGMEILGLPWTERKLVNIAANIDKLGDVRKTPDFAKECVPPITPVGDVPSAYTVGVLE